jgi:Cu/Zn superoxide dismutase
MLLKNLVMSFSTAAFLASQNKTRKVTSNNDEKINTGLNAICIMYPDHGSKVQGVVSFHQDSPVAATEIVIQLDNLKPNSKHGFHIH